jgi:hypothetical protein
MEKSRKNKPQSEKEKAMKVVEMDYDESTDSHSASMPTTVDRFTNKELNFSITWYPDLKSVYNDELEKSLVVLEKAQKIKEKNEAKRLSQKNYTEQPMPQIAPMFLFAHELFDALPVHQFKYLGNSQWCERVV